MEIRIHESEEARKRKEEETLERKSIKERDRLDKITRPLRVEESKIMVLLEKLDQKNSNGEIDEDYYKELKDKYEKELNRIKKELVQKELLAESGLEDIPPTVVVEEKRIEYDDKNEPLEKEDTKSCKDSGLAIKIIAGVLLFFLLINIGRILIPIIILWSIGH